LASRLQLIAILDTLRKMRRTLLVATLFLAACRQQDPFQSSCTLGAPPAEAALPPGRPTATTAILPGGRKLTPAGTLLDVGGFPIAVRLLPGDRYAVVTDDAKDDEALRVVDLQAADPLQAVVSSVPYKLDRNWRHNPGLLYGLALSADGARLYVSNGGYDPVDDSLPAAMHYNTVQIFDVSGAPPQLVEDPASPLKLFFGPDGQRIPTGIQLSADGSQLYVANQGDSTLAILSLASGAEIGTARLTGVGAYDVAVDAASHTAFVSLWGGDGDQDGIVAVDVTDPTMPLAAPAVIQTGKAAEAELLVAGKLYVSNADADTLSIVDAAQRTVKSLPVTSGMILGATPNAIAVEPKGQNGSGRVYLADAGSNDVVAFDLDTLALIGRVPTAWYPTAVAVRDDGSLVIASARGLGTGPNDGTPEPPYSAGTLQVVPRPSDADLRAGDMVAAQNLDRPRAIAAPLSCRDGQLATFPLPPKPGAPSPLEHVFLIVRENKTYDALLGDLPGGNGQASLASYGEKVTPNAHALARAFVTVDNFYSHAELSVQGHEWTTGCIANDYTEKSWLHSDDYGRAYLSPVAWGPLSEWSRLATPGSGSVWHHLDVAGVAYHNYGEITNTGDAQKQADPGFPGIYFNTNISDVEKADYVIGNLTAPHATLEPFTYLLLPNDHTNGTAVGKPTPESMIADNDEATGRFVDGLSRTPFWKSSIVFVVEDDPGGTLDHVEAHRSILLVASPWIKRGAHISTNYDLGSVYATIELILGVGPMNLNDAHAAPLYELFTTTPDFSPFTYVPRTWPVVLNPADAPLADESAKIDFSRPDQADLTRILWKAAHGRDAEPPTSRRRIIPIDDDDD
jgi:DNA-binding beta-propeller fold protein YncE